MPTITLGSGNDLVDIYIKIDGSINGGALQSLKGVTLDGGAGIDKLTLDDFFPTSDFSLSTTGDGIVTLTTSSGIMQFKNFESLSYSNVTYKLGTAGVDNIVGTSKDDKILYGLGGNDTIDGGAGSDRMYGGLGNDTYIVDSLTDIVDEKAAQGTDTIKTSITYSLVDTDGLGANGGNVENLTLTGTAAINGTGNALNNVIIGNSAVNTLTGNAGNDTLNGGAGADIMAGGVGNDTYVVDRLTDVVTELVGQGADTIMSSITYSLVDTDGAGANGGNVENLTLTGTANINATGNSLANFITGNTGTNMLTGGLGRDIFDFNSLADSKVGALRDIITDFVSNIDKIDLRTIDANSTVALDQAFSFLTTKDAAFTHVAGQLRYITAGANTVVEGDVNGDGVADFQIQLNGNLTLHVTDFYL
jgi:Ca2+-binding RTX toxin-like protein